MAPMAFIIAEPCIGTKDTACVEVCPVDCIHQASDESSEMLYIDPDECIDCAACVPACPVEAIFAEGDLPSKWAKYTQINLEFFASGGPGGGEATPVGAPATGGKSAPAAKKAPEPEPLRPLEISAEKMYRPLSELREDLTEQRQNNSDLKAKKSPAIVGMVAAVVLIFVWAISNNLSKAVNSSLYSKIGALAIQNKKPKLGGMEYSITRKIGGKNYLVKVSDSIFGSRTLTLQIPAAPFGEDIYHKDEKFFAANENQESRFFYVFIDKKSDGTLDAALKVREFWSKSNQFLGRYQKPLRPTSDLQNSYHSAAQKLAKSLGLT
jgi:NAD-dependent dihydropyrimidine dehydrogenase PreA subunit